MDISLYYDFECIVKYGSISEAAKHLHITQPALSRRLNNIEQEVGLDLFERTSPIYLTPAGEVFLEYACRINAEKYKLSQLMARMRSKPIKVVHVAGLYSKRIGPVVRSVKHKLDGDSIFIDIKQESHFFQKPVLMLLQEGKLEVAIEPYSPSLDQEGIASTPFLEEPIVAVITSDNPLAKQDSFDGADLARMRFISVRDYREYTYDKHLRWLCKANGLVADSPRSIFTTNAVTFRDVFLEGLGDYAIIAPDSTADILLSTAGPGHIKLPFSGKHPNYDMRFFHAEKPAEETLQFINAVKEEFARREGALSPAK